MTMTTIKAFEEVSEAIANGKTQRFPEAANDGDYFRQGDIYIVARDGIATGQQQPRPNQQLAPGTTQGSRHILDSLDGVTLLTRENSNALDGPTIVLAKERTVTHPEHGDVILPVRDGGSYDILYQRAYAEELRRVVD